LCHNYSVEFIHGFVPELVGKAIHVIVYVISNGI
jgi:hypothetical protein